MARAPAVSSVVVPIVVAVVVSAVVVVVVVGRGAFAGALVGEAVACAGGEGAGDLRAGPVALAVLRVLGLLPAGVVAEVYVGPVVLAVGPALVLFEGVDAAAGVLELDGDDVVPAEDLLPDLADLAALGEVLPRFLLAHVFPVLEGADRPCQHLVVGRKPGDFAWEGIFDLRLN